MTTPAEAGIAFLDGPRIGGYGAEPDLAELEEHQRPTPPRPDRSASFAARGDSPARPEPPRFIEPVPAPPRVTPVGVQSYDEFSAPPRVTPVGVQSHNESPAPPRVESPAPPSVTPVGVSSHDETPEERERRLRASKTEIVEVGKIEGAPAKRGWWRRGG